MSGLKRFGKTANRGQVEQGYTKYRALHWCISGWLSFLSASCESVADTIFVLSLTYHLDVNNYNLAKEFKKETIWHGNDGGNLVREKEALCGDVAMKDAVTPRPT